MVYKLYVITESLKLVSALSNTNKTRGDFIKNRVPATCRLG